MNLKALAHKVTKFRSTQGILKYFEMSITIGIASSNIDLSCLMRMEHFLQDKCMFGLSMYRGSLVPIMLLNCVDPINFFQLHHGLSHYDQIAWTTIKLLPYGSACLFLKLLSCKILLIYILLILPLFHLHIGIMF
jgi:hypothetical protein